ncbi:MULTISPECIES: response regulator [Klebsiella]|jgi:two-component system response regulator TtrR|uniref:Tetrathionate reductase two-component response regulator n=4 Tax=Klebsiella pneumoniae TaxID=573 RepID=A0A486V5H1_KLEPN|nr:MULTISPECIES: response regulator [Klebsiella]HBM7350920.1 response regulator transcription factor [Klebsiella oxytoca]HDS9241188.1 response regulator transcription factor [Klebsiella pneumoniae subsp. pneumoniae]EJM8712692.1 response regulator transcription factor [Klebsiella pneumoniae]EKC1119289.1 response regulator transcription factor [Klebsiella pneumoniae]EKT8618204.1 response regulator transcription factor [Klebsiella pneumoniae]
MIHLVDDDEAVTNSCCFLLESQGYVVKCWNQSEQFLREAPLASVGIALLDMRMPGIDGHELFRLMREENSSLAVIFLTGHGDVPMAVKEIQCGAVDFLEKPIAATVLQLAIKKGYEHSASLAITNDLRKRFIKLTPKEKTVAQLVYSGLLNKDIAEQMNIALRTVEVHRSRVMEKMGVHNFADFLRRMSIIKE